MTIEIHKGNVLLPVETEPIIINGFELLNIVRCKENEDFFRG